MRELVRHGPLCMVGVVRVDLRRSHWEWGAPRHAHAWEVDVGA